MLIKSYCIYLVDIISNPFNFFFKNFILFNFTILYWFCFHFVLYFLNSNIIVFVHCPPEGIQRKIHWHAKRVLHIFLKFVCLIFSVRKFRQLCKLFTSFNEKLKNSVTLEKPMSHASPLFAKASHL